MLNAEHERRLETVEPVMSSRKRNLLVIKVRHAIDFDDSIANRLLHARSGKSDLSPLQLAAGLLTREEEA